MNTEGLVEELVKALQDDSVILALGEIFDKRVKDLINKVNEQGAESRKFILKTLVSIRKSSLVDKIEQDLPAMSFADALNTE